MLDIVISDRVILALHRMNVNVFCTYGMMYINENCQENTDNKIFKKYNLVELIPGP